MAKVHISQMDYSYSEFSYAADFHTCVADGLYLFPVMSSDCSMVAPADGAGAVVQEPLRPDKKDHVTA